MSKKKNLRRLSTLVTAQTLGNLEKLAAMAGYGNTGRVIDKLVRDHMMRLRLGSKKENTR
ncbi:MAG: hypothetical protein U0N22_01575 [Acutalibacter sp.]|jgi:hypothetical protein|nr:MAG TPA: hypothetical protein [Caudoviricetes sp.]